MDEDRHASRQSNGIGIKKKHKKIAWKEQEDADLKDYVQLFGEKNWNDVPKFYDLARSGKSCRLRWVNHLKPNLNKGHFTEEEKKIVVELHAQHGNKWAYIASRLPGRTNDCIKNFWHTRTYRLKRGGGPIEQPVTATAQDANQSQDSLVANYNVPSNVPTNGGFMNQSSFFSQPDMNNLIASSNMGTTFPFTGTGYAMNEQSPHLWNNLFVESTPQQLPHSYLLGNATNSSTFGTLNHEQSPPTWNDLFVESTPQQVPDSHLLGNASTFGTLNHEQSLPLWNNPYVESTPQQLPENHLFGNASTFGTLNHEQSPSLWNNPYVESTPQQLPDSHLLGNASNFGTLNHEPSSFGAAQSTPMSALDTNNTWKIISDFPPPLDDVSMETTVYGSNTDLGSSLFQPSSLGCAELTPTIATGQSFNFESDLGNYSSTSTNELLAALFDDDWIKEYLGEE